MLNDLLVYETYILIMAVVPYAALLLPILVHYNRARPRNKVLVDRLAKFQVALLFLQAGFLLLYAAVKLGN